MKKQKMEGNEIRMAQQKRFFYTRTMKPRKEKRRRRRKEKKEMQQKTENNLMFMRKWPGEKYSFKKNADCEMYIYSNQAKKGK